MPRVRDFRPAALDAYASPKLQVGARSKTAFEGPVWQFAIFLPRWLLTSAGRTMVCTAEDEARLEDLLEQHFGGYTVGPSYQRGIGRRRESLEANVHRVITVYLLLVGGEHGDFSAHCAVNWSNAVARSRF